MNELTNINNEFSFCYTFMNIKPEKFWKVPKFFAKEKYKKISSHSKLLYSYMLDRMSLSLKNNLCDNEGQVYIFFTIDETMEMLNCSVNTALKVQKELEGYGLIYKSKSRGLHPSKIYVKLYMGEQ